MKVSRVYGRDSRSSHPPAAPHASLPNFGDPTIVGFQGAGAALQKALPRLLGVAQGAHARVPGVQPRVQPGGGLRWPLSPSASP